jgi:hypothetical protein
VPGVTRAQISTISKSPVLVATLLIEIVLLPVLELVPAAEVVRLHVSDVVLVVVVVLLVVVVVVVVVLVVVVVPVVPVNVVVVVVLVLVVVVVVLVVVVVVVSTAEETLQIWQQENTDSATCRVLIVEVTFV